MADSSTGFRAHHNARRELRAWKGAVKEKLLPKNVVMVIHKPGHSVVRRTVEGVYRHYGITPVHSKPMRFTPGMVKENYRQVVRRLKKEVPNIKRQLVDAYASKKRSDKNIRVEFLHIPNSTIRAVDATDAWDAIKKIAGKTKPEEAYEAMLEGGYPTIRGAAFAKYGKTHPATLNSTLNVVHVPDPHPRLVEQEHLTGRWPDLDLFTTLPMLLTVRRRYNELKKQGKL